ncbi:MAG: hypothetical protein Q8S58_03135, partial [Bosea sp. (in: a-proteobacteria)]|nr:hypothetical protein [Bosea sp. (in: a-proteobacteria)]
DTYLGYAKSDLDAYKQIKASNIEVIQVDPKLTAAVVKASGEWADKQAASNAWFKKAYDSQKAFMASVKPLSEFRFAVGSR